MNENNTELYPKIFTWLFIGLLISFASGYALSLNQMVMANILVIGALPILIIELVSTIFCILCFNWNYTFIYLCII